MHDSPQGTPVAPDHVVASNGLARGGTLLLIVLGMVGASCAARSEQDAEDEHPPGQFEPNTANGFDAGFARPKGGISTVVPLDLGSKVVMADPPPPPISGGTLLVARDGRTIVAADPDRDRVWIVDGVTRTLRAAVQLRPGDEPGRAIEDDGGRVHVALRRGGALVTIDPASGAIVARRSMCAAPRGLAFDAGAGLLHVACVGGELVSLPPLGARPSRVLHLDADLRDVVMDGEKLLVSRFRSAEVLTVEKDGTVSARRRPAEDTAFAPTVAWRMVPIPTGGALMIHQRASKSLVDPFGAGWHDGTDLLATAVTELVGDDVVAGAVMTTHVLPVDIAMSPSGRKVAFVLPGNRATSRPQLWRGDEGALFGRVGSFEGGLVPTERTLELTAVAFLDEGTLVAQSHQPAALLIGGSKLLLGDESRQDTGHVIFHAGTGGNLACASCHPEGRDDGHVWLFKEGKRRTQALAGGLLGTEPLHWSGDLQSFAELVEDVFVTRMTGPSLDPHQIGALARWIDRVPLPERGKPRNADAAERGRVLFGSNDLGCSGCHSGPKLTNNTTVAVGTGGYFQVPSLRGLAFRAPYLHDGCAPTLRDRFGPCGGSDKHGRTSHLDEAVLSDLIAYLETL